MKTNFVSLFPAGKTPFKVALAVADDSSTDPFERIGRQTLWSRRVRAGVVSSAGAIIDECVLHLPAENIGDSSGGEVDRQWATVFEMFLAARGGGAEGYFPELIVPGKKDVGILPPLVYCSVPRAFFSFPCQDCFEPLQTCRDDAFLAKWGLPIYSTSPVRVLACPKCCAGASPPTVVDPRPNSSSLESKARVLKTSDYLDEVSARLAEEKLPKGSRSFNCSRCPEQDQCWGWSKEKGDSFEIEGLEVVGSASQGPRWRVFTTHSVPFLLTRPAMIPLESFIRQISSEAVRTAEGEAPEGQESLLFSSDGSGMDAVEILTLRLTAFGQAVRAVKEYHRIFERAHLDIRAESLVVATEKPAFGLPALWNFDVRLEATTAVDSLDLGHGISVIQPPRDPVAPFFSHSVKEFLLTGHRVGELKVERFTADSEGTWRMEGHLVDPRGVYPRPGSKDWIKLQWVEDPCGLGVLEGPARVDPRTGDAASHKGVFVTTEPLPITKTAVEKVKKAGDLVLPNVTYRVYPQFGPKDDLHSLGMLMFLCVLVNDTQDLGLVTDDLGLLGLDDHGRKSWTERAREQMAQHPDTWGPNAVLFDAVDRSGGRPNAIPEDLWIEILTLGLRMVAAAPDLGVENESGPALFGNVEAEVAGILRRLRAILFDRQPLNLEIQTVISELLSTVEKD